MAPRRPTLPWSMVVAAFTAIADPMAGAGRAAKRASAVLTGAALAGVFTMDAGGAPLAPYTAIEFRRNADNCCKPQEAASVGGLFTGSTSKFPHAFRAPRDDDKGCD